MLRTFRYFIHTMKYQRASISKIYHIRLHKTNSDIGASSF